MMPGLARKPNSHDTGWQTARGTQGSTYKVGLYLRRYLLEIRCSRCNRVGIMSVDKLTDQYGGATISADQSNSDPPSTIK
jgi:hypothetical protein